MHRLTAILALSIAMVASPAEAAAASDPLAAPTSRNAGSYCAAGLDAASLDAFFTRPHGWFAGADYQRAYRLADGRVLWMFQDALVSTPSAGQKIVHNMGMIQSGRCFRLLGRGLGTNTPRSWLLAGSTVPFRTWFWPLGGAMGADGSTFHLVMAQMAERGTSYLRDTRPVRTIIVDLRVADLGVISVLDAPNHSASLYGFAVTSDATYSYLYSHCHRQFPMPDPCTATMRVARVPRGRLHAAPSYWNGRAWVADAAAARPVVSAATTGHAVNPAQIQFDGRRFVLVEKEGDWFGTTIVVQTSPSPTGPWRTVASFAAPNRCGTACNTYFASWVPWRNPDGRLIIGLSHNRWDGRPSPWYRPTVHPIRMPVDSD